MSGYTKLFNSILASTIWEADDKTRIVWITMLAMANKEGIVEASVPGLATFARVERADCEAALQTLMSPDPDSRSKEREGRRIQEVDGGWFLINHGKHRNMLSQDERREYLRVKQREHRARRQQLVNSSSDISDKSTKSTHTEADTEADTEAKKKKSAKTRAAAPESEPRKRPVFQGQRFVVFEWQLDDLMRLLGSKCLATFNLDAWLWALDARCVKSGEMVPQRDGGDWLRQQTLSEVARLGFVAPTSIKPTKEELAIAKRIRDNAFGCKHDPRCPSEAACLNQIVHDRRATASSAKVKA